MAPKHAAETATIDLGKALEPAAQTKRAENEPSAQAAPLTQNPIADFGIDGALDGASFLAYVEQVLAPTLSAGETVLMDNVRTHKVAGVKEAIEAKGARLVYLPPYSPDFDPIEESFSKIKSILRRIAARTAEALEAAVGDPTALEAAFRRHAAGMPTPPAVEGLTPIAVNGKTLRGSFDAFADRKAAHMMSALRHADQIVLAHVMVAEKSNEIPTAPELIEALGLTGCLFTLDAEHCQKNCSNA